MKIISAGIILLFSISAGFAQLQYSDSLKQLLGSVKEDSDKVAALGLLSAYYSTLYPDSGVYYADKIIEIANKKNDRYSEVLGLLSRGSAVLKLGDFAAALQMAYKSLNLSKQLTEHRPEMLSRSYQFIGEIYSVNNNPPQAVNYLNKSIDLQIQSGSYRGDIYHIYYSLAFAMLMQEKMDSALYYVRKGQELYLSAKMNRHIEPWIVSGNVYKVTGNPQKAEVFFRKGIELGRQYNSLFFVTALSNDMARLFLDEGLRDSCLKYAHQCLYLSRQYHYKVFEMYSSGLLSYFYDKISTDSTLKYLKINVAVRDEILNDDKIRQFQSARFEEEKKETELENAKTKYNTQLKMYAVIGSAMLFLVIAIVFYRNNRHKQKANYLLKEEKGKVEETLVKLKSTQALLIQSEKMASLGELTAGIAHEIQNPLNFVNNFSEVNKELLSEMNDEIIKNNFDEVKILAKDIAENEEKIYFHGRRADAIVKGMLQHSRSSSSVKEPTGINALCEEYLRLSYHGLRAKDKSFNADFKTDFDNTIGKINIVPQDIGRVLLNLLNNAFYAVNERQKAEGENFKPVVSIQTKKKIDNTEIIISDNGNGIPQNIVEKIFQPFFTTKPTGQGTGLGLSLAYDIIKAHGGGLKVETKVGQGTSFIIQLPITS